MTNARKPWVMVAGAAFGALTLLFFMALLLLAVFGREVPCDSRMLVVAILAFGAAMSVAFLGGAAAAKGSIPIPFARNHPLGFSMSGGVAVLVILLVVGSALFQKDSCEDPLVACSEGYQGHYISQLRFGFCYPRHGWEVDRGAIDVRAADIYVRNSSNRDVGVHFHVSMIPSNWAGDHRGYSVQTANTWRQLDENLQTSDAFISGRPAFRFALSVKDRNGTPRPTEVIHVYLSTERLLEIISTRFEDTPSAVATEMGAIVSSTSIYK